MNEVPELDDYVALFEKYGDGGLVYLRASYLRFSETKIRLMESLGDRRGAMLDIGAHWLHQTLLYALDGFDVTASDIRSPGEMDDNPIITAIAAEHHIRLLPYKDLKDPIELNQLPENSFDVILFCEIIEHITFNPVPMWQAVYRLLKPGGRIVVTTPNYYWPGYVGPDLLRPLRGISTGLPVADILGVNDYGHHWKIYSARDLRDYFALLSSDFVVERTDYFDTLDQVGPRRGAVSFLGRLVPILRDSLYMEIVLKEKRAGVSFEAHW